MEITHSLLGSRGWPPQGGFRKYIYSDTEIRQQWIPWSGDSVKKQYNGTRLLHTSKDHKIMYVIKEVSTKRSQQNPLYFSMKYKLGPNFKQ